jgi:hypothetical protein
VLCTDVVGLVTFFSAEKECVRDGKATKKIVLRMIDNRLVLRYVLEKYFGNFSMYVF